MADVPAPSLSAEERAAFDRGVALAGSPNAGTGFHVVEAMADGDSFLTKAA